MGTISWSIILFVVFINLFTIAAGYLVNSLILSRNKLKEKGYKEEYIEAAHKRCDKAGKFVLSVFISSQAAMILTTLFLGTDVTFDNISYIIGVSAIVLVSVAGVKFTYLTKKPEKDDGVHD